MILIVCVDDNGGMMFNKRRQSKDRLLRERILGLTSGSRLWMSEYTQRQFTEPAPQIAVADNPLDAAQAGDYCFVEREDVAPYEEKVEKIILYKWNRSYPSDLKFGITLPGSGWKLVSSTDFIGNSHKNITEEVYER